MLFQRASLGERPVHSARNTDGELAEKVVVPDRVHLRADDFELPEAHARLEVLGDESIAPSGDRFRASSGMVQAASC